MIKEEIGVGKSIDEAIADACAKMGVSPEDANLSTEVLEAPVKKLFKIVPGKVKVTLTLEDAPVEAPAAEAVEAPAETAAPAVEEAPKAEKAPREKRRNKKNAPVDNEPEEPIVIEENVKVQAAVNYLAEVFAAMGAGEVEFSAVQKGEATIIKVVGQEISVLIGRRGETMESLSYLASLVANREEGEYMKLGLDVAGYRGKRESDLQQLARRMGAKVRKTGRSHAMDPMNPYERRIIHSAIGQMDGLRSESSGEGKDRHVVIYSTDPNASNLPDRQERRSGNGGYRGRREGGRGGRSNGGRREGGRDGGRGGRGGRRDGGYSRGERKPTVPQREFAERVWDDTVPIAPARTERINDADGFALYGKIDI